MIYDYALIGAGLSGGLISYHLSKKEISHVILEKGRGLGGRFSTKRIDDTYFNHGSRCISFHDYENQSWFQAWIKSAWVRKRKDHWSIETKSSDLIRSLIDKKNLMLNEEVKRIIKYENHLQLMTLNQTIIEANKVILTVPLPQVVQLAPDWIDTDTKNEISKIIFLKKIIFFIKNKKLLRFSTSSDFSIESKYNCHMITFSDDISAYFFESSDEKIISSLTPPLVSYIEDIQPEDILIKKWHYAEPLYSLSRDFLKSEDDKIYAVGDGFCALKNSSTEKVFTSVYQLLAYSDLLS